MGSKCLPSRAKYTIFQSNSSFRMIWEYSLTPFCQNLMISLLLDSLVYLSSTISYSRINSLFAISKSVSVLKIIFLKVELNDLNLKKLWFIKKYKITKHFLLFWLLRFLLAPASTQQTLIDALVALDQTVFFSAYP